MKHLFSFLHKSYPLPEERGAQLKMAGAVSFAVFLFLFIVRPFYMGSDAGEAMLNCVLSAAVVFVVVMLHFFVLFPLFPHYFREDKWTVGREMLWTLLIILSIALTNIGLNMLTGSFTLTLSTFFLIIAYTAMVGMAPASVSIVLNQMRLLRRYKKAAAGLNQHLQDVVQHVQPGDRDNIGQEVVPSSEANHAEKAPAEITVGGTKATDTDRQVTGGSSVQASLVLVADNGKDELVIAPADLLSVTSADNYCKICYRSGYGVRSTMLRISLKKVEAALAGDERFWRCHRTAIVNLPTVEKVSGTAQGYQLHLPHLAETIPVSRSLNAELKKRL